MPSLMVQTARVAEVHAQAPPKVEYSLTSLGATLAPIIDQLDTWGATYRDAPGAD